MPAAALLALEPFETLFLFFALPPGFAIIPALTVGTDSSWSAAAPRARSRAGARSLGGSAWARLGLIRRHVGLTGWIAALRLLIGGRRTTGRDKNRSILGERRHFARRVIGSRIVGGKRSREQRGVLAAGHSRLE
ncbi:MAG: hypothetical protein H7067_07905 [Burkholderiales bacterium]|nr:hypothetical protein [Opitutaceae bacterium]